MFDKPSLITRIAVGKAVGFIIGMLGFFLLPHFYPDASTFLRWGILLWYITFGAIIAVFGVFTYHPILKLPFPWWIRAPLIGAWLNFVLVFFAHNEMQALLISMFGQNGLMQSPFWFVAEGAIIGLIIGFFATHFGGEGREVI